MPRTRQKKRRETEDRNLDLTHPCWAVKRLNKDLLLAAAHAVAWAAPPEEVTPRDAEKEAEWFQTKLAEACNVAMPRVRRFHRDATYWWSPELGEKRQQCVSARRKIQRQEEEGAGTSARRKICIVGTGKQWSPCNAG